MRSKPYVLLLAVLPLATLAACEQEAVEKISPVRPVFAQRNLF